MMHNSLDNYLKTMFALCHQHGYSISELEDMVVWEKDYYVSLVQQLTKKQD